MSFSQCEKQQESAFFMACSDLVREFLGVKKPARRLACGMVTACCAGQKWDAGAIFDRYWRQRPLPGWSPP